MTMAADPLDLAAWHEAWLSAGARTLDAGLHDALIESYQEPQRGYHTLQHLREALALLPRWAAAAMNPPRVALALWFHDAVYDPQARGRVNERRSADWARSAAWACGTSDETADALHALVMATCHDAEPIGPDAQLLVDIDLAILGADAARFDEYERQVRAEYDHVPDDAFRDGRRRILRQFLDRPVIYRTPASRRALEARARANLARSIAALSD
jgi:predicted metal-dependent HD superfamily phosphohydrolase